MAVEGWRRWGAGVVAALVVGTVAACQRDQASNDGPTGPSVACEYPTSGGAARPVDPPPSRASTEGDAVITLELTAGSVTITMPRSNAPCAINSFESLAQQGFYDNTDCHRLVDSGIFVLQCGDPTGTGRGGPGYSYADELTGSEKYTRGVVAMANAGPDSNGSQFFLVWDDSALDADYTVLGTMDAEGLKVVSQIASQGVDASRAPAPIAEAKITKVVQG